MLTKSFVPNVSKILYTTCLAMSFLWPVIDPDTSINITISLGLLAASIYHDRNRQSYKSTGSSKFSSFHCEAMVVDG